MNDVLSVNKAGLYRDKSDGGGISKKLVLGINMEMKKKGNCYMTSGCSLLY